MLQAGDVPHVMMFSQARFAPGHVADAHSHDQMTEVFFVESGQGEIRINGESRRLEPGVCVVAEAGETHEVENTGSTDLVLTYFGVEVPSVS